MSQVSRLLDVLLAVNQVKCRRFGASRNLAIGGRIAAVFRSHDPRNGPGKLDLWWRRR
jgi:hypothetical protein